MELKNGNPTALDGFWDQVTRQGTPLVEPIPGDPKHVLVTFLWRDGGGTKNVVLYSSLTSNFNREKQLSQDQLVRLANSDVWWKTYRVRKDARFTYYFSLNDRGLILGLPKQWGRANLQPDPLNPHRFVLPHGDQDWVTSVVELPDAASQHWLRAKPGVAKGQTETYTLRSRSLGNERRFWVYTPPHYSAAGKPYRLLMLFDGSLYARMIPTTTIIENLLAAERIPPFVVVLLDQKDRDLELSCYEPFNEFLVRELIPWVREHYHVTSNPAETAVGGQSRGGLAAAFAGLRHPEVFGNVLSLSGYFSWDPNEERTDLDEHDLVFEWIIRQFAEAPRLPLRFVLTVGLFERDHEFPDSPSLLQANRHLRDVLLAKGYSFRYTEVAGGHEVFSNAVALPDALASLFSPEGPLDNNPD